MFYLPYFDQLRVYTKYYYDVNDYSKFINELRYGDTLEDIVERVFARVMVYSGDNANAIVSAFHLNRLYFQGIELPLGIQ